MTSKRRYLQLIEHAEPWPHYAIHEALLESGETFPYWVGSKAIKKYDTYELAIVAWGKLDAEASSLMDILHFSEVEYITDRIEYQDETEINFD